MTDRPDGRWLSADRKVLPRRVGNRRRLHGTGILGEASSTDRFSRHSVLPFRPRPARGRQTAALYESGALVRKSTGTAIPVGVSFRRGDSYRICLQRLWGRRSGTEVSMWGAITYTYTFAPKAVGTLHSRWTHTCIPKGTVQRVALRSWDHE